MLVATPARVVATAAALRQEEAKVRLPPIDIGDEPRPDLDAVLGDRIYAFNVSATGIEDGAMLNASIASESGEILAGISGHTWGGCCEITRLWVAQRKRGLGWGAALMRAAEAEAVRRGCGRMVLSTHSFQAPGFYEKLGFARVAAFSEYPKGHEQVFYCKLLAGSDRSDGGDGGGRRPPRG